LYENTRGKRAKDLARQKVEDAVTKGCTFKPKITEYRPKGSPSTDYDYDQWPQCPVEEWGNSSGERHMRDDGGSYLNRTTINMKQPEKMAREIRVRQLEREEKRRSEIVMREIEELTECTFQPQIPVYSPPPTDEPVVVRGIGRHLELKHLKGKIEEDKRRRAEEVFSVRNVDRFRKAENGQTIVEVRLSSLTVNIITP